MNNRKQIFLGFALAAAASVAAWHFLPSRPEPGSGLPGDRTCKNFLARENQREALGWLQESRPGDIRTLGEQTSEDSLKIVQQLYSAGAVSVHAVKIDRVAGVGETVNVVCVELPAAGDGRPRLFKFEAGMANSAGFDPVSDDGQTYLFLANFKLSPWQIVRSVFKR
jgi:hypothetical protein